jgi:NadR type nicotinamide-nucleotide adenylyltransferase
MDIKKISVIGPESTGKSTLCEQLAMHNNSLWCPEYAREYLQIHGTKYTYDDLLTIAKGQVMLEEKYINIITQRPDIDYERVSNCSPLTTRRPSLLFIDTDMYVMKVWCEFVFGKCHRFILDQIVQRKYDLILLCNVDLPWVKDELREYPDLETRKKIYSIYKDILINQAVPWVEISGDYATRLQRAVSAVEQIILRQ